MKIRFGEWRVRAKVLSGLKNCDYRQLIACHIYFKSQRSHLEFTYVMAIIKLATEIWELIAKATSEGSDNAYLIAVKNTSPHLANYISYTSSLELGAYHIVISRHLHCKYTQDI